MQFERQPASPFSEMPQHVTELGVSPDTPAFAQAADYTPAGEVPPYITPATSSALDHGSGEVPSVHEPITEVHESGEVAEVPVPATPVPVPVDKLCGTKEAYGRDVVDAALNYTEAVINEDPYSGLDADNLASRLRYPRSLATEMGDATAEKAARYLDITALPPMLMETLAPDGETDGTALFRRLGEQNEAGEFVVPDEVFVNVLQWHNYRVSQHQATFDRDVLPVQQLEYVDQVRRAVDNGDLPPQALAVTEGRLANTKVWLDDGFNTHTVGVDGTTAMRHDGSYEVFIGPEAGETTFRHEHTHIPAGEDEAAQEQPIRRSEYSGVDRVFGSSTLARLLNEATVDHITSGLQNGDFTTTDITHESRQDVKYTVGEKLLHAFAEAGVPVRRFIDAYYESGADRDRLGGQSAEAALLNALQTAYPGRDMAAEITNADSSVKFEGKEIGHDFLAMLRGGQ